MSINQAINQSVIQQSTQLSTRPTSNSKVPSVNMQNNDKIFIPVSWSNSVPLANETTCPSLTLKDRTTHQTSNHLSITSVIFSILSVMPFTSYWIRSAVMLSFFLKDPVVEVWIKLKCQVRLAWVTHLLYFVIERKDYFPLVKGVAK